MSDRCLSMQRNRTLAGRMRPGLLLVGILILLPAVGCRRTLPPAPVPESQPTVTTPLPQTPPLEQPPETRPPAQSQPARHPRHFEVFELGAIKPDRKLTADQPLAILVKAEPQHPATVRARLLSDTLMTIDTDNVRALRLDLLNLPREQAGRLVLHIDGQGIEISGKKTPIIYLQRSPVGEWSFGRPANPPAEGSR